MTIARHRKHAPVQGTAMTPALDGIRWELQELGLRPYAARLLLALLQVGSGTSSQLAQRSGVPRTSVYQVMEPLIQQGLVEAVPTVGPAVWTCPGWEEVVDILDDAEEERLRQHHQRTERLRQEMADVFRSKLCA